MLEIKSKKKKDQESHSFWELPIGYNRSGVHLYGVMPTFFAEKIGIALPLTHFHRKGTYVEERSPRPHSFSTTNLPQLGGYSSIENLCARAEAANDVTEAQPVLDIARALDSPETQWRYPAPPSITRLQLVRYQTPSPAGVDSNSRITTMENSWLFVEKFIHLVHVLPVGQHPREYLVESVRRTFPPSSGLLNPPVLTDCVRTAININDIDVVGDILTHRLDCLPFLSLRLTTTYPTSQREENVEGFYWSWIMREARNRPDLLSNFLDSTSTNPGDLISVSGAHAGFCGVPINWMLAMSWLAAKWDQPGRPDFSLSTLMFYRLWRVINLKPKFVPLARLVLNWLGLRSASQSDFQLSSEANGELCVIPPHLLPFSDNFKQLANVMPAFRRQASAAF